MEIVIKIILPALLTGLIYYILNKFAPADKSAFKSDLSIEQLRKKYLGKYLLSMFLYLFVMVFSFVFAYFMIKAITSIVYDSLNVFDSFIQPTKSSWYILVFILGFDITGILSPYFYKLIVGKDFDEFMYYTNSHYGIDNLKFYRGLSKCARSLAIVFIIFNLNNVSNFTKDKIIASDFFEFKRKHYAYTDVNKILYYKRTIAPSGKQVERNGIIIEFKDGRIWESYMSSFGDFKSDSIFLMNNVLPKVGRELELFDSGI